MRSSNSFTSSGYRSLIAIRIRCTESFVRFAVESPSMILSDEASVSVASLFFATQFRHSCSSRIVRHPFSYAWSASFAKSPPREAVPSGLRQRRRCAHAARDHVEALRAPEPGVLRDPPVEVHLDVRLPLEAVEGNADAHVRGAFVLREHPHVPRGGDLVPQVELAVVREVRVRIDVREAVLQRARDVARLQEGLDPRPPPDLGLEAVRRHDASRREGELLVEALHTNARDVPILLQEADRGRFHPDVRAGLRGALRERLVEPVPLEDDADLVPRVLLVDLERSAVRRDDLRAGHLLRDPLLVVRDVALVEEVAGDALSAPDGGADLHFL